jgi:hypothetical protein
MEQRTSCETGSRTNAKNLDNFYIKSEVHNPFQNSLPLDPVLIHMIFVRFIYLISP